MYQRPRPSARTQGERGKMSQRPKGRGTAPTKSAPSDSRPHTAPVAMTLRWRSGQAEPWVEITIDGKRYMKPGTKPLWEIILWANGWRRS